MMPDKSHWEEERFISLRVRTQYKMMGSHGSRSPRQLAPYIHGQGAEREMLGGVRTALSL